MVLAVNTFGMTAALVADECPFMVVNANTQFSSTKAQAVLDKVIGRCNAILSDRGVTPEDITEEDYPIAYLAMQELIVRVARPRFMVVMNAVHNVELYTEMRKEASDALKELATNPREVLGSSLPTSDISPQVETTSKDYALTGTGVNARPDKTTRPYQTSRWDFDPTRKGNW